MNLYDRNTTTPVRATTTTNASGYWAISHGTEGRFDVEIVNGTTYVRLKYDDAFQVQELETSVLKLRNPADTFAYDIVPGAITAARTLNIPVITGTDTLAVLSLAQTFTTGVKTFNSSILAIRNPADTFSYTVVGSAITAARNLTIPLITADDTIAVLGLAQTFTATQTFSAATAAAFGSNTITGAFTASGSTVTFSGGTASTSISTGTIVISGSGGLGIGGAVYIGSVTAATSGTTGALVVPGGIGVGKQIYVSSAVQGEAALTLRDTSGGSNRGGTIYATWGGNGIVIDTLLNDGHIYLGTSTFTDHIHMYANGVEVVTVDATAMTLGVPLALAANNLTMTGTIAATGARVTQSYHTNITSTNAVTVDSSETVKHGITPYMGDALAIVRGWDIIRFRHDRWLDPSGEEKLGIRAESVGEPLAIQMIDREGGQRYPGVNLYGIIAIQARAIQQLETRVMELSGR